MPPKRGPVEIIIDQTFLNGRYSPITIRSEGESSLDKSAILWLLESKVSSSDDSFSIGVHPSFSKNGRLSAIAYATATRVLLVHSLLKATDQQYKPQHPRKNSASPSIRAIRAYIQDSILNSIDSTILAFNGHEFALALHQDLGLISSNVVDLLSLPPKSSRDLSQVVKTSLEGYATVYPHVQQAFEEDVFDVKEPVNPSQKAWLAFIVGNHESENLEKQLSLIPRINLNGWNSDELNLFASSLQDARCIENAKSPLATTTFVAAKQVGQNITIEQDMYQNRLRKTNNQKIYITMSDANAEVILPATLTSVKGKSASLTLQGPHVGQQKIQAITIEGKSAPSQADSQNSLAILYSLQQGYSLNNNIWIKRLFPCKIEDNTELLQDNNSSGWASFTDDPWSNRNIMQKNENLSIATATQQLNKSQLYALQHMLDFTKPVSIIQGPPGTGKTHVIAIYASVLLSQTEKKVCIIAESNIGILNIAEKLIEKLPPAAQSLWKLIVSSEFKDDWHDHLYKKIPSESILLSKNLNYKQKPLLNYKIILCTKAMLLNERMLSCGFINPTSMDILIVDEASQIPFNHFLPLASKFGTSLKKICFFGDNKQLPPYSQSFIKPDSIFEKYYLLKEQILLDIQYRMPPSIGNFIGEKVYDSCLESWTDHSIQTINACQFINIIGIEESTNKMSFKNTKEADAVLAITKLLIAKKKSFKIITPYDLQRATIEALLKSNNLPWSNTCYNVDSFQGNEDDYIIISIVRTKDIGFLYDNRRSNVMLTRAKKGMFICTNFAFLKSKNAEGTLLNQMINQWSCIENGCIDYDDHLAIKLSI